MAPAGSGPSAPHDDLRADVRDQPGTTHDREVAAVARGGLANLAGAAVSAIANFLLVVIVARFLSPVAAGVFFGVTSLFLIVEQVLRLGADTGAVYFVARWRATGVTERIRPGLRAGITPAVLMSLVAAVVLELVASPLARTVADGSSDAVAQLRVLGAVVPIAVGYDIALGATRGFRSMRASVVLEKIARPLVQVVLCALVLAVGWRDGLAAAWGLPYIGVAVAAAIALRRMCAGLPKRVVQAREVAREFWAFSLPRAVAGAAQIVLQRLDIVLVAAIRGPREAAIYTAASRFLVLGQFLSQGIAAPVQPRLSAALSRADTAAARSLYRISTTWIVLVGWPLFLLAGVLAPEYLDLFGHRYSTSAAIAVVITLAASMLVATASGVVDSVIVMAGRPSWNLWTTLVSVAVNVVLDVLLIPSLGIVGAAIGWCAAIVANNVVPVIVAWRKLGLHPFGAASTLAAVLSVLAFAVLPVLGRVAGGLPGTVVGAVVGGAVYCALVWRRRQHFDLTGFAPRRLRRGASA